MISEFRWVRIKRKSGSILLDNQQGVFENSDAVAEGFAYARYFHQTGIDPEWETNPLVKLGEKLMQEHTMLDFHKIVLDTDYRKSLWKRP